MTGRCRTGSRTRTPLGVLRGNNLAQVANDHLNNRKYARHHEDESEPPMPDFGRKHGYSVATGRCTRCNPTRPMPGSVGQVGIGVPATRREFSGVDPETGLDLVE